MHHSRSNPPFVSPSPAMEKRMPGMNLPFPVSFLSLFAAAACAASPAAPRIEGEWWTVAGTPDLGEFTSPNQQPVDFAIWPAADGTWQLWSCIRGTREVGRKRLLHRWEGARLTDSDWKPMGVAMRSDPKLGEGEGNLQAPYVFTHEGRYIMYYGDWVNIRRQDSEDGKTFVRGANVEGQGLVFGDDLDHHIRDPMMLRRGDTWICYYTANPGRVGSIYARTSKDLRNWTPEQRVAGIGLNHDDLRLASECPFVVELKPGEFYLFHTQKYGPKSHTTVRYSRDPLNFLGEKDAGEVVTTLPVAAPEIFRHEGHWYIAATRLDLRGIRVARLTWEEKKEE